MIHSVIAASNPRGNVLFSKLFSDDDNFLQFQQSLFEQSQVLWAQASNKCALIVNEIHVVFAKIDDLLLFVCGGEDCDEIIREFEGEAILVNRFQCVCLPQYRKCWTA